MCPFNMGIYSPGQGSSSANPYHGLAEDAARPGVAPSETATTGVPMTSATLIPINNHSSDNMSQYPTATPAYPSQGPVYYPTTQPPGGAMRASQPQMAFPVHSHLPRPFAPTPNAPGGPDVGPWSDRCCENNCCCGACHDCCYPAHTCCRCPPWFLVTAYVLICVSFLVNFGTMAPFFSAFVSVKVTSENAIDAEAWNLQPSAQQTWYAAEHHYRVAEITFNGETIDAWTALETVGTFDEEERDEIGGSSHWTVTSLEALNCEKIEAFYADGKPGGGRRRLHDDDDEDSDSDEEDDEYDDDDDDDFEDYSAVNLNYYGMWPHESAVRSALNNCENIKQKLKSAGGAEVAIRALTFPLGFVLVALFGVLVSRCSADCRRNACHKHLPTIGRASFYLLAFILFVDLVCFAHYAQTFPDMDDKVVDLNSIVFALILPTLVSSHAIVAVGDIDMWEMSRGGFGVAVFVWMVHVVAILLIALAAKSGGSRREFDVLQDRNLGGPNSGSGSTHRKGWGRWYRPERENDPMPSDVATEAPRALQMPPMTAQRFR